MPGYRSSVYSTLAIRVAARYRRKTGASVDIRTLDITADSLEQVLTDLVSTIDDLEGVEKALGLDLRSMVSLMAQFQHNDDAYHNSETVIQHTKWVLEDLDKLTEWMDSEHKLVLSLAAMMHDLGKAYTYQQIKGKHTFYGHAEKSVVIAEAPRWWGFCRRERCLHCPLSCEGPSGKQARL